LCKLSSCSESASSIVKDDKSIKRQQPNFRRISCANKIKYFDTIFLVFGDNSDRPTEIY
jgi:hypothetical protein